MRKIRTRLLIALCVMIAAGVTASTVFAFDSGGNPGTTGANTITWTGQGASNGVLDTIQCDAQNDPNGANQPYLLWILTVDGGSITNDNTTPTLTLGGTGNGSYQTSNPSDNSAAHFITPYFTPDYPNLTATVAMNVLTTGTGAWNLVISHGCPGGRTAAAGPSVMKTAAGSYDDTYTWTVNKAADKTSIGVNDQPGVNSTGTTVTVNYTLTDTHGTSAVSNVKVTGTITVHNPDTASETLDSIADTIVDGSNALVANCTVDMTGGLAVAPGDTLFPYSCDLGSSLPSGDVFNTVTVAWSGQDVGTTQHLAAGSASYTTPNAITFTANEIDTCDTLTDTFGPAGLPHKYCVGDGTFSFTFMYSKDLMVPALGTCVNYTNTATSTTNDLGLTPSDSVTVTVCHFNAPLTIGYWKTHISQCAPHVKTGTGGCNNNGPFTVQYLPQPLGNYVVSTGDKALAVFNANNCSSATDQGAVGCLAAQLLAAELNVANHSNTCISSTISAANAFLVSVGYTGPTGTYTLTSAQRTQALTLKTALDTYNNGGGC
jgi:hypothetical protein